MERMVLCQQSKGINEDNDRGGRIMDKYRYAIMKEIMLNLSEWFNMPDEELENMLGISWQGYWNLLKELQEEE